MSDTTELIKEKLDLVDFLRQYLALSPAGKNLKALCPFHKEKTPSFIVSPERQVAHCFGCSFHGDIIGFLMKYENLEFVEALRILAERAGIDLRLTGSTDQKQYAVLYDINEAAKEFFKVQLTPSTSSGHKTLEYLKSRGLKPETIGEFELGLAPNTSDSLSQYLLKKGYKLQDIERAGLTYKTERGTYWDRFRNRIMFPLHNHFGKTIGFTGRIMPDAEAATEAGKYINSPETPIFNKSRLLFGFYKTKNAIRDLHSAVVVEGQMDFLLSWQDGVKNLIATSGTALTPEHLKNLKRISDTIVVGFDADEAGEVASERIIDLAQGHDFSVKILSRAGLETDCKDPADIAQKQPGLLSKLVAEAEPAMKHYFRRYLEPILTGKAKSPDVLSLKRNIRVVLAKIKNILSPIEQAHWLKELSTLTKISEQHLFDEMQTLVIPKSANPAVSGESVSEDSPENFSRRDLIAQRFVSLALVNQSLGAKIKDFERFLPETYREVWGFLISGSTGAAGANVGKLADLISLRSSLEFGNPEFIGQEFEELGRHLRAEYYRDQRETVGRKIREAEQTGNQEELGEYLREFDRLSKEI